MMHTTLGIEGKTWGKIYNDSSVFAILEPGKNTLRHEFESALYLYSAAPELLIALKEILLSLNKHMLVEDIQPYLIEQAKIAIAKAEKED